MMLEKLSHGLMNRVMKESKEEERRRPEKLKIEWRDGYKSDIGGTGRWTSKTVQWSSTMMWKDEVLCPQSLGTNLRT